MEDVSRWFYMGPNGAIDEKVVGMIDRIWWLRVICAMYGNGNEDVMSWC